MSYRAVTAPSPRNFRTGFRVFMGNLLLHNLNIVARIGLYLLWAWIVYFDGLQLSEAMRSFLNCIVLADIATWLLYQIYLLPRMLIHFGIGTVVNLVVMFLLIKGARSFLPQTADMQAMAAMVFFAVAGVKGFYYFLLELGDSASR